MQKDISHDFRHQLQDFAADPSVLTLSQGICSVSPKASASGFAVSRGRVDWPEPRPGDGIEPPMSPGQNRFLQMFHPYFDLMFIYFDIFWHHHHDHHHLHLMNKSSHGNFSSERGLVQQLPNNIPKTSPEQTPRSHHDDTMMPGRTRLAITALALPSGILRWRWFLGTPSPSHQQNTIVLSYPMINGDFRILEWRYQKPHKAIYVALWRGDIPSNRPHIGLIYVSYLQFSRYP